MTLLCQMPQFKAIPYTNDGALDSVINQRAFLHSSAFEKIFNSKQRYSKSHKNFGGYLKVINGQRSVYLKYQSLNGVKADEVQLSYAVRCALNVIVGKNENPKEVEIRKSCWVCYYCSNADEGIKWPFRIAVLGLIITIFSIFLSVISLYQ